MLKEDQIVEILTLMRADMATKADISCVRSDIARLENEHGAKLGVLIDGQKLLMEQKAARDRVDELADEVRFLKKMCYDLQEKYDKKLGS